MDRIAQIKQFLEATPNDSFLKHALALEYIKLNDDVTARQLFEELLAHEPGYVGSYYHLGKLLERAGDNTGAISIYEKGMAMAKAGNERHAYNELQSAYEDLLY
ncbi:MULTISPECIES: tetratricopeptide repeat protein [Chitinophaga]|uniref:tetratricopeptide repeat protein n=1 Tax=Chitinophaga TaxID=79328 RepID=UPI001159CA40|nr:tetratricopeptide repeat protein [Chitinophaga polysaccharea]